MCPVCMGSAYLIWACTASAGGLAAITAKVVGRRTTELAHAAAGLEHRGQVRIHDDKWSGVKSLVHQAPEDSDKRT